MEVLDHLNAKGGRGTLYFAGQDPDCTADEAEMLSRLLYYKILGPVTSYSNINF